MPEIKEPRASRKDIINVILDTFRDNLPLFKLKLDSEMKDRPLDSYMRYVYPLLPKNLELTAEDNLNPFTINITKTYSIDSIKQKLSNLDLRSIDTTSTAASSSAMVDKVDQVNDIPPSI